MTPGDPLPPPSRHIEPPFSVGEVREVVEKPSTPGGGFSNAFHGPPPDGGASRRRAMRFTARPRVGGRRAVGRSMAFVCVVEESGVCQS